MNENEMRELKHGEKIKGPDGTIYIVHNNHHSGEGIVVATRSVVIPHKHARCWNRVGRKLKLNLEPGVYQVTVDKKIS